MPQAYNYKNVAASSQYAVETTSNLGIDGGAITMSLWLKINSNPGAGGGYLARDILSYARHQAHTTGAGSQWAKFYQTLQYISEYCRFSNSTYSSQVALVARCLSFFHAFLTF